MYSESSLYLPIPVAQTYKEVLWKSGISKLYTLADLYTDVIANAFLSKSLGFIYFRNVEKIQMHIGIL